MVYIKNAGIHKLKLITSFNMQKCERSVCLENAGSPYKKVTHKVEALDKQNFIYSYSVIEGDAFSDKYEKITYHTKLEASDNGGSVIKGQSKYVTKGDAQVNEDDVKANKDKASWLLKAVETYLLANPHVYS